MLELNFLVIVYVSITTLIMVASKVHHKSRNVFYCINSLILIWEIIPFLIPIQSHLVFILYDWSPLLFLPLLHRQTGLLTRMFYSGTLDQKFIDFDKKHFPRIMNLHDENRANSFLLSEFLHLCYFSFYALIYGVPLYFYLHEEYNPFYQTVFVVLLLLFSCYFTHWLVPICGPRNLFEKIKDHRSQGFFFRLVHKVLEDGSTHGTAFPSGHTGTAAVVLLITYHLHTPLFYSILPFGIGLIISTIYGRFHYVTDVLVGLAYALVAFFATILVYN